MENVLILASGKGTRIQSLSNGLNKALVPIGNKATLSYIIEKFPKGSNIFITLGYLGEQVQDFCSLAYPDYNFLFIPVPDYEGVGSGPGKSALYAEPYLQSSFYFCTCDCIVSEDVDFEDHTNWIGIQKTDKPEIYSTAQVVDGKVCDFKNKDSNGFENAFIGLAHIETPQIFWSSLKTRMVSGELVEVFKDYQKLNLRAKHFTWYDTGNPESFKATCQNLCIEKNTGENLYHENSKVIKYFVNSKKVKNLFVRGKLLGNKIPGHLEYRGNFIAYDWIEGSNLYELPGQESMSALKELKEHYENSKIVGISKQDIRKFYRDKTFDRVRQFREQYGEQYYTERYSINGKKYYSLDTLLSILPFEYIYENVLPFEKFHGDFQPANLVKSMVSGKIYYIDWRDSFGEFLGGGDIYYELGKLLGGLEINYDNLKNESKLVFKEQNTQIEYNYSNGDVLPFKVEIETWKEIDYSNVELVRCLIQLSMSPLHTEKTGKFLWFRTIENLTQWLVEKKLLQ